MKRSKTSDSHFTLHSNPFYYEPTSVLDPHLTSSPASAAVAVAAAPSLPDDWDPLSYFISSDFPSSFDPFDLPDLDFLPTSPTSPTPTITFDRSHLDLLIKAAASIESNDLSTAHLLLARLNHLFPNSNSNSNSNSPLQRAAFHFKDALLSLLPIPNPPVPSPPLSPLEIVHRIAAHKAFSDLSPIPQFTSFTANQTLIESLLDSGTPNSIHLIDFEIGFGGQWSSFAQEIAARSRSLRAPPPHLRITAVVSEETPETALAADNLRDFARAAGVRLGVDFVRVGALGALALGGVRLNGADAVGVVLTPSIFRLLGGAPESAAAVLRFVRRVSPRIVVFVDSECFGSESGASFRRSFVSGLEYYAAVLESVEAAAAATGAGEEAARAVERGVVRPRVFGAVAGWGPREMTWRGVLEAGGMAAVEVSEFTESQAEWVVTRAAAEGFHVARREGSMVLSWKGRDLAATSAWRC